MQHLVGGQNQRMSYSQTCGALSEQDGPSSSHHTLCSMLRMAGVSVLACASLSALGSVMFFLLTVATLLPARFTRARCTMGLQSVRLWRLSSLSHLAGAVALLTWLCVGHLLLNHADSHSGLGLSWVLFLIAWGLEMAVAIFMRRAVGWTPDPTAGAAGSHAASRNHSLRAAAAAPIRGVAGYLYMPPDPAQYPYLQQQQQQHAGQGGGGGGGGGGGSSINGHCALEPQEEEQEYDDQSQQTQEQYQQQQHHPYPVPYSAAVPQSLPPTNSSAISLQQRLLDPTDPNSYADDETLQPRTL